MSSSERYLTPLIRSRFGSKFESCRPDHNKPIYFIYLLLHFPVSARIMGRCSVMREGLSTRAANLRTSARAHCLYADISVWRTQFGLT